MAEFSVDYQFYVDEYGSSAIPATDWKRKEREARATVASMTFARIYKYDLTVSDMEAVKFAICAAAEKQYAADQIGNISSETNDGLSRTYKSSRSLNREIGSAITTYLAGTTLLYRGLDYDYQR